MPHHHHPDGPDHVHADEPMLPLEAVQRLVLERCRTLETLEIPLAEALGTVLVEDVVATEDIPPFPNTAMDGYAVRSEDTARAPVELEVVGVLPAGAEPPAEPLGPGQALQIMTGAPMPPGADAVAIVERSEPAGEGRVRILDEVAISANVRPAGSDLEAGALALAAGSLLQPAHLGMLASVGRVSIPVFRKPVVGVMSTGDELVQDGAPLRPGQIRDSNRATLLALVRRDGYPTVDLGPVADTRAAVSEALERGRASCDVVLSSGGVSKGEFDFVKVVLDELATRTGGESFELAVAIRPAKPLALAWLPRTDRPGTAAFFGLPGNPVSAVVSYHVVALPALRRMAGQEPAVRRPVAAVAGERLSPSRDGRLNLVRTVARIDEGGRLVVRSAGGQQSHQLSGLVAANSLTLVPAGNPVEEGERVAVLLLDSLA